MDLLVPGCAPRPGVVGVMEGSVDDADSLFGDMEATEDDSPRKQERKPLRSPDGLEESGSLHAARNIARERLEWLTCHAPVAVARGCNEGAPPPPPTHHNGGCGCRWGSVTHRNLDGDPDDLNINLQAEMKRDITVTSEDHRATHFQTVPSMTVLALDAPFANAGSYRSASRYLSACSKYSLQPNGGALLGLSLGLEMLEVDGSLSNLELVPLCAALLDAPFVKHLKLSGHPLQDTGAAVLAIALPGCPWIKELELVGCKITGEGTKSICQAIPKSGVTHLVLRGNRLRQNASAANSALAELVLKSQRLTALDLQSCGLASQGMRQIKQSMMERSSKGFDDCRVNFEGNFVLVEVMNSLTHGVCALICLEAWRKLNELIFYLCHFESRASVTLYVCSMLAMFTGSTLYHSMFAVTGLSWFFAIIDHCAIYFLIAGTYTPVLVMGCRDPDTMEVMAGVPIWTSLYWSAVSVGIVMEHLFAARKPSWYSKFILSMYILLGFGGVPYIATCPLVQAARVMTWLELGGLTYVIGVVFFLLDRRYPAMHVIWHLLVGVGAFFHFVAVWNLTTEVLKDPHRSCGHSPERTWLGIGSTLSSMLGNPLNSIQETHDGVRSLRSEMRQL